MIVLVTGGRHYSGTGLVSELCRLLIDEGPIDIVINGGARGADTIAKEWADDSDIACETMMADWDTFGKRAGSIRNQAMVDRVIALKREQKLSDYDIVCVAAPGGHGTADCVRRAQKAGIRVNEVVG